MGIDSNVIEIHADMIEVMHAVHGSRVQFAILNDTPEIKLANEIKSLQYQLEHSYSRPERHAANVVRAIELFSEDDSIVSQMDKYNIAKSLGSGLTATVADKAVEALFSDKAEKIQRYVIHAIGRIGRIEAYAGVIDYLSRMSVPSNPLKEIAKKAMQDVFLSRKTYRNATQHRRAEQKLV